MKILLALDGSDYTKRMLAYIAAHDELLGPGNTFTLLTAVPAVPAYAARFIDDESLRAFYRDQAKLVLDTAEAFARQQSWHITSAHVVGHAAAAIAEFADAGKYDLLVMGTRGHSAMTNMVLGSVSNGVLARTRVPVLLVH